MTEARQNPPADQVDDRELDWFAIVGVLWSHKIVVVAATLLIAVASVVYALSLPNLYRANALLAPNQKTGADGLSALASEFGGLAGLAGISIANESGDRTAVGLEVLKSRRFLTQFIERHDLLVPIMAGDGWDHEGKTLVIDEDVFDTGSATWVRRVRAPRTQVPSYLEAYDKFIEEMLTVNHDKKTQMVTVSVEFVSPVMAQQWTEWLIEDVNQRIMSEDVQEANQAIALLREQIEVTLQAELRNMLFRLIEEQTKTVLLAAVSREYFLKTIDPAVVPEEKSRPRRAIIVIGITALGGFFVCCVVLFFGRARIFRDHA